MKRGNVSVYIPMHIKKRLHIYAIRKNRTLGSIISEAALHWVKDGLKEEMKEMEVRKDMAEIEKLRREMEDIQEQIDYARGMGRKSPTIKAVKEKPNSSKNQKGLFNG